MLTGDRWRTGSTLRRKTRKIGGVPRSWREVGRIGPCKQSATGLGMRLETLMEDRRHSRHHLPEFQSCMATGGPTQRISS